MKKDALLIRLLRTNISKAQLTGYVVANVIGLAVILTGVLFYSDCTTTSTETDDRFIANDYVIVSKNIDGIAFAPVAFSENEIADIARQPWARKVGRFSSSQFGMRASASLGGRGLSTYMFCESVPDEFFDIKPSRWNFDPQHPFIPIIISKDYLSLYNFGFAMPQGLPKLSEDVIGSIPIDVTLTGQNGLSATFEAAIVGFSSRLNTIAVPQSFIDWANNRFAPGSTTENAWSSRLIVKTDPLLTSQMQEYFSTRDIEIAGDREADSRIAGLMRTVAIAVTANGAIICALAFFILTLSIYLLLQKNENMLRNVIRLGYQPNKVSRIYERLVARINCGVGAIALTASLAARSLWLPALHSAGLGGGNIWTAIGATAAFIALSSAQNTMLIRRRISALSS